jgi:DNA-binding response OmpR family regulator
MHPPYKLLLVDDTPENLSLLIEYLAQADVQLFVAENGPSALERLQRVQPDLILLDVLMPGMSGFELCQRIKANPQTHHIPVIFLTARDATADKLKGFTVGGVDYITKPLVEAEVLARVRTHLRLAKAQQQLSTENYQLHKQLASRSAPSRSYARPAAIHEAGSRQPMIRLTLFGEFRLTVGDEERTAFRSDMVRALLAYLVLEGQTPLERDAVAALLWPGYLDHTRRNSLRVALHNLRYLLQPVSDLLIADRKTVQFQVDPAVVWCDVLALDQNAIPAIALKQRNSLAAAEQTELDFLRDLSTIDSPHFQRWRQQWRARYAIQPTA